MHQQQPPPCPRCQDNLCVRAEQVISGRRVTRAYYCGRCHDGWQVESAPPHGEERRESERRKMARASLRVKKKLPKAI
jgi:hypothetical protein